MEDLGRRSHDEEGMDARERYTQVVKVLSTWCFARPGAQSWQLDPTFLPEGVLARVAHVQKVVLVLVFLIYRAHQCSCWWENLVYKNEDGLLWGKLDTLAYYVDKLSHSKIRRYEILLLVNGRDVRAVRLLADYWNPVWVLLPDTLGLGLALLKRMLVLEFRTHNGEGCGL